VAHPITINEIMHASKVERKLIQYHATTAPAKIFVFIYLIESSAFVPINAYWLKMLYHSILLNRVTRGSRDEISDV
jgi:hypothetical protein